MNRLSIRWAAIALLVLLAVAGILVLGYSRVETTLEFVVRDAVSSAWVWDMTATIQDRVIRTYYQSDRGSDLLRFTRLSPGSAELRFSAPSYESVVVPVTLERGHNRLAEPIEMIGYEIPDLARFVVFPVYDGSGYVLEIRPVGTDGFVIENHPALPIWIGARVSVHVEDTEAVRGKVLFLDRLAWEFVHQPEELFRYRASIPIKEIEAHPDRLRVFDYVIVVPDPRVMSAEDVDRLMMKALEEAVSISNVDELRRVLGSNDSDLSVYVYTSWSVEARR